MGLRKKNVLPGFGLSLGYTVFYLSLVVLIPFAALFSRTAQMSFMEFWDTISSPRVVASFWLSLYTSLSAASLNAVMGLLVAWVLVRYHFPLKTLIDALVDLPFALPTAVAGISLTTLYSVNGPLGKHLARWGIEVAYTPLGIIVALTFIGLPFVVRTLQPVLEDLDVEIEEAAASLGASRMKSLLYVVFPNLLPALLTGFALSFARAFGEYGSVVFISGNMPMRTEICPLLIMTKLEQFDYIGATAIAVVMLLVSFMMLFTINLLGWWSRKRTSSAA